MNGGFEIVVSDFEQDILKRFENIVVLRKVDFCQTFVQCIT